MLVNHNSWSFGHNTGTATYNGQPVDYLTGQGSYNPYGGLYTGVPDAMQYNAYQNSLHNQSWNVTWMGANQRNSHHENIARQYIGSQSVGISVGAQTTLGNIWSDYVLKNPYNRAYLDYGLGVLPPNHPLYGYAQQRSIQQQQQYNQEYAQANQQISQYFDRTGITALHNNVVNNQSGYFPSGIYVQASHNIPQNLHNGTEIFNMIGI